MSILVRIGLLAGAGALAYKIFRKSDKDAPSSPGEPVFSSGVVRDAGPKEQKDFTADEGWDTVDEESDASFPASDPPGNF